MDRITHNRHPVGKVENYSFCSSGVLDKLSRLIRSVAGQLGTKVGGISEIMHWNMSGDKVSPMTRAGLERISGDLTDDFM